MLVKASWDVSFLLGLHGCLFCVFGFHDLELLLLFF